MREGEERFHLIVGQTRHSKNIQPTHVHDLCDYYPLTQWMLFDRFCGPKKCEPFPSPRLHLRVGGWGTPLSDAGWSDWLVWSCTCWRSYWKTLQSFDQIRSNLNFELLFEWQGTSSSGKMVDKFVGTWKMTTSDNFDEYMKALGMILHHLNIY